MLPGHTAQHTKPYQTLPNLTKPYQTLPSFIIAYVIKPFHTKSNETTSHHTVSPQVIPNHAKPYQTISNHTKPQFTTQIGPQLLICWQVTEESGSCGARLNLEQQRAQSIFLSDDGQLHVIKCHGILNAPPCFQREIKKGGSADDGKWDGLSGSPPLLPLTTNLARHDGFELLMTLLLEVVVVVAHGPHSIVVVVILIFMFSSIEITMS